MIWLFLLPFFVLAQPVLASPTIKIDSVPLPFEIGTSISIPFTVTNTDIGNSYHYKVVGVGVSLDNLPDVKCNDYYNNCPIFSVGTSETIKVNTSVKIYDTTTTGYIYVKFVQADNHNLPSNKDGDHFPFDNNSSSQSVGETTSTVLVPIPTLEPSLIINSIPLNATQGNSFNINFVLSNGNTNSEYYVKAYGGVGSENYAIEINNNNWQNGYNGDWDKMPKFVTDATGQINQNLTLRAKTDKPAGQYKIIVKAKEISSSNDYYSSYKNIDIFEITSTTIPSLSPSATPTSTSTPSPFPTIIPLPTDNSSPSNDPLPTDDPNSQVLGIADSITPIPTQKPKNNRLISPNLIPTIFIVLGAGFLLIPLIISKIKLKQ